jgi:hypothetical protein
MTYGALKTAIDAAHASVTDNTKIREINFTRHSQHNSVSVGYDADKDEIRVVQQN